MPAKKKKSKKRLVRRPKRVVRPRKRVIRKRVMRPQRKKVTKKPMSRSMGLILVLLALTFSAFLLSPEAIKTGRVTGQATGQVTGQSVVETVTECSEALIEIQKVYVDEKSGKVIVAIKNSGSVSLTIILSELFTSAGNVQADNIPILNFDAGETETLTFSSSIDTCPDDFFKVTVTTDCAGVSDMFSAVPRCI